MGVFILIRRPFDNWIENTTLIISNLCYTVVLILFLIVDTKTSLTPAERYHNLGTPIVGFIIAIIVINLTVAIITIITIVAEACKRARNNKLIQMSQVALKMKRQGLNRQVAIE